MTDLNNTNASDEPTSHVPDGEGTAPDLGNLDAAWAAFQAEHRDELDAVASSRNAKRFRRHAERKEKEALLSVEDLSPESFARTAPTHGPRDFDGSSWLDTDRVMDEHDDGGFTPPNPTVGPVRASTLLFWALLAIGLAGTLATTFAPALRAIPVIGWLLDWAFGLCMILGAGGLILKVLNRRGPTGDRGGYFDDGARI